MADDTQAKIDLLNRAHDGADGTNDIRLQAEAWVHVSQQYLEIINDGADNRVRLSQQYLEIINDGGANKIRLSQQYLEIIHEFGTPPPDPKPGKKGQSPGQLKKDESFILKLKHHRQRREVRRLETDATAFIPAQYLSPGAGSVVRGPESINWRTSVRRISTSPSGHTVRND